MTDALYIALVVLALLLVGFQVYLLVWTKRTATPTEPIARALRIFNVVALVAVLIFVLVTQILMRS